MYVLYFLLWIIFNGNVTLEICIFGFIIAAIILAFTCKFMDYSLEKEKKFYALIPKAMIYICVLVREIIKANLAVMKMILSEREELQPALFNFSTDLKTPLAKALLANSITLTPGTITVEQEGSQYVVHALDESLAPGSSDSVFVTMLSEMEGEED